MPNTTSEPQSPPEAIPKSGAVGTNLRRFMAREGLTYDDVMRLAGVTRRTVQTLLNGSAKPHAQTLRKIADGLGVGVDELIESPEPNVAVSAAEVFDQQTNPAVSELAAMEPALFDGWTRSDFAELRSRFGEGGALTVDGARAAAEQMNRNRETLRKARVVLESREAVLLQQLVDTLYSRVCCDR